MKKIILLILVLLFSCGPSKEEIEAREKKINDSLLKRGIKKSNLLEYQIYVIEGHEYITFENSIIHSYSCKNEYHK